MSQRPFTLTVAAVVEAVEGAAALTFGLFVGWETVTGKPVDPPSAIGVTVLAILGGVGMLAVARGLSLKRRSSRSPAVVSQILALPVSWSLIQSGQYGYGVPLIILAVTALVLLLTRASHDALLDT